MPMEELSQRLMSDEKEMWKRPLLKNSDPKVKLEEIFEKRKEMYEQADVCVKIGLNDSVDEVVLSTTLKLKEFIEANPPKWQEWKEDAKVAGIQWLQ
mmetsp:Transcript_10888/g.16243  ORF Transcript_10888/g.16243 Transcript_10888/m.16243 type:complete len:97 (-) Transcript_10888:35-325(-)